LQEEKLKEAFMPFSLGQRGCLGQNFASVWCYFLRFYNFNMTEKPDYSVFGDNETEEFENEGNSKNTARVVIA
jgi:hypothetical protein